ncbi:MAG: domain S-box [Ramlibacter sp.]|nr:domain S-box [Ramlibacter sp.]
MFAITMAAYLVTAAASTLAFGTTTPVWYSDAILLVPLLLRPVRQWLFYLAPAWLIDTCVIHFLGSGPAFALGLVDLMEVVVAASIVRVTGGLHAPAFAAGQIARVLATCVLVPMLSAAFAAWLLLGTTQQGYFGLWRTWYSGDALGLVTGTLFILSWNDPALRPTWRLPPAKAAALAAGVAACVYLPLNQIQEVLVFATFPLVFALTWSFGLLGATLAVAGITFGVLFATITGHGAIADLLMQNSIESWMEAAQIYLACILASTLPLTVLRARQAQLTESLRRASDARTEFLAAMSHEIRTPMTGVLGLVDLLVGERLDARQQGYVDALRVSGRHLLSIINDILDFSRIESGRLELEQVNFTLRQLLEGVRSLAHPLAVERGLTLKEELRCSDDLALCGDELRLRQVLLNLVSNAIKFTERGEVTVRVGARAEQGCLRMLFDVCDTGVGIPQEKLAHLFAAFTQADQSTAREYGGSGLGLAISKRLVEAMGGSISATSAAGQGSVFSFEVPLAPGKAMPAEAGKVAVRVRPLRILIAEDVEINRHILRTALGKDGHQLEFATDGAQAVAMAQAAPFDVVLMDVQMPVMDGVEATRRIRALGGRFAHLPILGLTANVMARERDRYVAAGMDDCLPKPIDWDLLAAALARHSGGAVPQPLPARRRQGQALLDERTITELRGMATSQEWAELVAMGLQGCRKALAAIEAAQGDATAVGFHAHKLKGSAGMLGMAAVSRLAGELEAAAAEGRLDDEALATLWSTWVPTLDALRDRGLLDGLAPVPAELGPAPG